MNLRVKHPTLTSSNVSWKSGDRASDQFPAGLRVLVVDDDHTCLRILEKMLKICLYEVTTSNRAELALEFLRDNKNGYDIVISDVHMPDMDGFKLLEHVGLEMDLPVIMMSADDSKNVVMKGITHGACDYLIKPVRIEALKNIWQHVVRKKKHEWNENDFEQSDSLDEQQKPTEDVDYSSSVNEGNWKSSKRRKEEEDEADERDDTSTLKKPRVVWSVELHQQFVTAVNQLGIDKAVPKKILELMNVPGLTRENVASHLQKYRLYLRRLSHQNGLSNSFMGPVEPPFGPISSLSRFDLQALAASGQLPPESLATIQAAVLGRGTPRPSIPPLLVDQRNIFGYENKKSKYIEGQQQQNDIGKQANFLHGIPTSLDSQQLATLRQSGLGGTSMSQSNSLLIQIGQPQPILNEINRGQVSNIPSSVCQPVGGPQYTSISQPSRALDFSSNGAKFSSNNFSLVGNSGPSSLPYKLQDEANSEIGASRGFLPNYDAFDDLNRLQNIGFTLEPLQHSNVQGGLDVSCGQNRVPSVNKGLGNTTGIGQQLNSSVSDSPLRIKAERFPDIGFQNSLFPQRFGQEDLISAILKQQQGTGPVENEFGFDGYQLDNLPV